MSFTKLVGAYAKYVPLVVPVLLVVVQALVDNGYVSVSGHTLALVNVLLAAVGFHALHVRTK